ncbi:MAG: hypothetical protein AAGJ40_03255 [Planctomycetota bacterium]
MLDHLRIWLSIVGCSLLAMTIFGSVSGCRLCADCDLDSYPTYGGAWQRTRRDSGRVGSIFDPGGSRAADVDARTDSESADARLRRENSSFDFGEPSDQDPAETGEDSIQPPATGEDERRLEDMENRFKNLQLEDIRKLNVPQDEDWH